MLRAQTLAIQLRDFGRPLVCFNVFLRSYVPPKIVRGYTTTKNSENLQPPKWSTALLLNFLLLFDLCTGIFTLTDTQKQLLSTLVCIPVMSYNIIILYFILKNNYMNKIVYKEKYTLVSYKVIRATH